MPIQDTNNFVITGIPRSGTSLLCNLINHIENVVCFNELEPLYQVDNLPHVFHTLRHQLKKRSLVPMSISTITGKEITDTQSKHYERKFVEIDIKSNKRLSVGSKINVPYLLQIEKILSFGYKVIFVTRDPVYAIASWNMHKNINEQYVTDSDFKKWPRYKNFNFKSKDRIGRQVELYRRFDDIMAKFLIDTVFIKYEKLIYDPELEISKILNLLDMDFELKEEIPELKNLNRDSRFPDIDLDEIREKLND